MTPAPLGPLAWGSCLVILRVVVLPASPEPDTARAWVASLYLLESVHAAGTTCQYGLVSPPAALCRLLQRSFSLCRTILVSQIQVDNP
jgi:hypothetical protein